jgi:hypothetical protein
MKSSKRDALADIVDRADDPAFWCVLGVFVFSMHSFSHSGFAFFSQANYL